MQPLLNVHFQAYGSLHQGLPAISALIHIGEKMTTEHDCHAAIQGLQLYGEVKLIIQQQED